MERKNKMVCRMQRRKSIERSTKQPENSENGRVGENGETT